MPVQFTNSAHLGLDGKLPLGENSFVRVVTGINLLATGQTTVVPTFTGGSFVTIAAFVEVATKTGAVVVAPIIRIGNNGTFDNLAPLFTIPGATAARVVLPMTLASPSSSLDIGTNAIKIDVQTAGTGAAVLTANIYILGINTAT